MSTPTQSTSHGTLISTGSARPGRPGRPLGMLLLLFLVSLHAIAGFQLTPRVFHANRPTASGTGSSRLLQVLSMSASGESFGAQWKKVATSFVVGASLATANPFASEALAATAAAPAPAASSVVAVKAEKKVKFAEEIALEATIAKRADKLERINVLQNNIKAAQKKQEEAKSNVEKLGSSIDRAEYRLTKKDIDAALRKELSQDKADFTAARTKFQSSVRALESEILRAQSDIKDLKAKVTSDDAFIKQKRTELNNRIENAAKEKREQEARQAKRIADDKAAARAKALRAAEIAASKAEQELNLADQEAKLVAAKVPRINVVLAQQKREEQQLIAKVKELESTLKKQKDSLSQKEKAIDDSKAKLSRTQDDLSAAQGKIKAKATALSEAQSALKNIK